MTDYQATGHTALITPRRSFNFLSPPRTTSFWFLFTFFWFSSVVLFHLFVSFHKEAAEKANASGVIETPAPRQLKAAMVTTFSPALAVMAFNPRLGMI